MAFFTVGVLLFSSLHILGQNHKQAKAPLGPPTTCFAASHQHEMTTPFPASQQSPYCSPDPCAKIFRFRFKSPRSSSSRLSMRITSNR